MKENEETTKEDVVDKTVVQSYAMVKHAAQKLRDIIALSGSGESVNPDLLTAVKSTICAVEGSELSEAVDRYDQIKNKLEGGLDIECNTGPNGNTIAEAEVPGRKVWLGPDFFGKESDALHSRPRIFIHEAAHTTGLEHQACGLAFEGDKVKPAQVSQHADDYAVLAYRLYAGKLLGPIPRNSKI